MVAELELADEVHFSPSQAGFQIRCEGADIAQRDNLAWRAAQALHDLPDAQIVIQKQIPTQAGLGGGSADAAATLLGLALICADNGIVIPRTRLAQAALQTGSDVPAFLASGLRVVAGVGDVVVQRACQAPLWGILLLRPNVGSPTANAYALLDTAGVPHDLSPQATASADAMCAAFAASDFGRFIALLHNDFTSVIESALPPVAAARERLQAAGAQATILCGSGSCVAGFFEDRATAHEALARLSPAAGEWATATGFTSD
ncbi:MAG: hypothetical protein M3Z41_02710 [Candidatus Eremiobacteraeota bacterium]|nr:hypothetical protein [Candidatus Eremiobacteraeota bacterium]